MTARSKTLLAAGTACFALGAVSPVHAWDTAPWNAAPFDQSIQLSAGPRAKIARVEAEAMARTGANRGGKAARAASVPSLVTDGRRGCAVNLGNVVLPRGAGNGADVSTSVMVKGDVITVCR